MRSATGVFSATALLLCAAVATAQWEMPSGTAPTGTAPLVPGQPPTAASSPAAPSTPGAPPGQPPTQPGQPPTAAPPTAPTGTVPGAPPTAPATTPTTPAQPYGQPVTAGGLEAPPPMGTAEPARGPAPSETEKDLDKAEEEDSGRGMTWFWLEVEGGYQYVGLETFTADEEQLSAGFESSVAHGGFVGAGLGLQLLIVRLGPRFRVGFFEEWQMYSVDGEVGFRIPIGIVEPHLEVAAGYTALGNVSSVFTGAADAVSIDGFNVRPSFGLDIFPTEFLSVGAVFSWELMGLTRPGVDPTVVADIQADPNVSDPEKAKAELLRYDGSSYGQAFTLGARLGLSF